MLNSITDAKLDKYFDITSRALKKIKIVAVHKKQAEDALDMSEMQSISEHAQKPHASRKNKQECACEHCKAEVVFDMAKRYFSDAQHFREKGDYVNAFAAVNYAHGWLDAGARLGLFDVGHDSELFTVD